MSKASDTYREIGLALEATESQMFGKPCFKTGKKAFVCFFKECMVFKLPPEEIETIFRTYGGCELFDPSGKGRAMKAWVQIPFEHAVQWKDLASISKEFVESL